MQARYTYSIYPCGDYALTIDFGNVIDENINRYVLQLFDAIKQKNIAGIKDVIPAYSSITVVYDAIAIRHAVKNITAFNFIQQVLDAVLNSGFDTTADDGRQVNIPACFDESLAPDLQELCIQNNISIGDIIKLYTAKTYRIFMLGFLPGFAYMGTVDERISAPRKQTPRIKVPAGSIGIAGSQTGIYPLESPGGWNIVACTPLNLFDATKQTPVLLQPGDYVQFYPVTIEEFNQIKTAP